MIVLLQVLFNPLPPASSSQPHTLNHVHEQPLHHLQYLHTNNIHLQHRHVFLSDTLCTIAPPRQHFIHTAGHIIRIHLLLAIRTLTWIR